MIVMIVQVGHEIANSIRVLTLYEYSRIDTEVGADIHAVKLNKKHTVQYVYSLSRVAGVR